MKKDNREMLKFGIYFFLFIAAIGFLVAKAVVVANRHDQAVMSVQYCWDSNGQHYVAPNPNCTH